MKLRPRTSRLLVLGAFLAAGATAFPALAERASADQSSPRFPGGRYFVIGCGFSHFNNDDPIVFPGLPGQSHLHSFFGSTAKPTHSQRSAPLLDGATTCDPGGRSPRRTGCRPCSTTAPRPPAPRAGDLLLHHGERPCRERCGRSRPDCASSPGHADAHPGPDGPEPLQVELSRHRRLEHRRLPPRPAPRTGHELEPAR